MKFGEKLKKLRDEHGVTQTELANELGLALQTISNYETQGVLPRYRSRYQDIADFFNVDVNYLINDEENFVITANRKLGYKGAKDAEQVVNNMIKLFGDIELPQEDKDEIFTTLQEVYWLVKYENKKYTPKKYLSKKSHKE